MELSGIGSSAYASYIQDQATAETKLQSKINSTDYQNADEDELLKACKQFEAYFMEQVFKEMEKTVDCLKDENSISNFSSSMVDYFKGEAIQDLATTSTDIQGTGLAQSLYEQMKRNYNL